MKKIFILFALISFTIFTACNKEEMVDPIVTAEEEPVILQAERNDAILANIGKADFTINNDDSTVWESGEVLLSNNSVNAVSYLWDFGNGDTSTEANPTYSKYKMHGYFPITLTITDRNGKTHKTSHDINVLCIFGGAPHQF